MRLVAKILLASMLVCIFLVSSLMGNLSFGDSRKNVKHGFSSKSEYELRLIVAFKQGLPFVARQTTHKSINGKIKRHFSSINADLVAFKLAQETDPQKLAEQLCQRYLRNESIKYCEPDHKIKFPFQRECGSNDSANSNVVGTINQIVQRSIDQHCEVIPSHGLIPAQDPVQQGLDGAWKVSPLWGQQVTGADLAADFVAQRLQSGRAKRVSTGNVDIISDRPPTAPVEPDAIKLNLLPVNDQPEHGDQTASLVSNPPFGVSPAVSWSAIVNIANRQNISKEAWNSNLIEGIEAIGRTHTRLVTASIGYYGSSPRNAIDSFVDRGRMFVQAAGNNYPVASLGGDAPRAGHIIVGSVGPNGIQTPFSQEPVKIYAPADGSQLSGSNERFGGTSGAAPLVTGAIVNVLAMIPEISNSNIEELLARTSLPSFPQKAAGYGPGLLNSFRLAAVAACLADHKNTQEATAVNLENATCLDQSSKAQEFRREADRLLKDNSCMSQRDGLKALRASFLLQPSQDSALRIAEMYERSGFPGDARWYRTAAATLGTSEQQQRHFSELLSEPSLTEHRYFAGSKLDNKARGFYALSLVSRMPRSSPFVQTAIDKIASLARSSNLSNQEQAIEQALIVGPRALPAIVHFLEDNSDFQNPRSAKRVIGRLTVYDGVRHSWIEETKTFFQGSRFEKYLPQERP